MATFDGRTLYRFINDELRAFVNCVFEQFYPRSHLLFPQSPYGSHSTSCMFNRPTRSTGDDDETMPRT